MLDRISACWIANKKRDRRANADPSGENSDNKSRVRQPGPTMETTMDQDPVYHGTTIPAKSELPKLIRINVLASILNTTVPAVHIMKSRSPHLLPPRVILPGRKCLLWDISVVMDWISRHQAPETEAPTLSSHKQEIDPEPEDPIHKKKKEGPYGSTKQKRIELRRRHIEGGVKDKLLAGNGGNR